MRVCLVEDRGAADLEPLTLTRPVFDLYCGATPLYAKHYRCFHASEVCLLVRPHLAEVVRERCPGVAVNDSAWLRAGPAVVVNGRWLPPAVPPVIDWSRPHVALVDDEVAYAVVDAKRLTQCVPEAIDYCLGAWQATLPHCPAGGTLLTFLWKVVQLNGEQIVRDFESRALRRLVLPPLLPSIVGPRDRLAIDPTARIEPQVVVDTTRGPVLIGADTLIQAFSRLEGPCVIGPGSQLHGARIRGGVTLGPQCRVGGEVEASILQGYVNKYHEGFLGHAYLGEWVNLGAGTNNSDLRNDYGEVTVHFRGQVIPTGELKVGCFLGDHTRSAIGTLLNTGTIAGVFCNLLPGGLVARSIPSFASWWHGQLVDRSNLEEQMRTAAVMMARRQRTLSEAEIRLYHTIHEETAAERRCAVRNAEKRALRRSA